VFMKKTKHKGFFVTEIMVALACLAMLIVGLTISLHGFAKFNLFQMVRMRCIAAAQAQLDSIATTGQPISDEDFKRLWPKLEVAIEESQGTGQWQGLKLVEVRAKGMSFDTPVNVRLSRYLEIVTPITQQEL